MVAIDLKDRADLARLRELHLPPPGCLACLALPDRLGRGTETVAVHRSIGRSLAERRSTKDHAVDTPIGKFRRLLCHSICCPARDWDRSLPASVQVHRAEYKG